MEDDIYIMEAKELEELKKDYLEYAESRTKEELINDLVDEMIQKTLLTLKINKVLDYLDKELLG